LSEKKYSSENNLILFGRHPVLEKLERAPREVEKIFLKKGIQGDVIFDIRKKAEEHHIPIQWIPEERLWSLAGKGNHQGVVATINPFRYLDFDEWFAWREKKKSEVGRKQSSRKPNSDLAVSSLEHEAVLILDEIEDPHNFGAIIRSATAAGMSGIFVGMHHQAPVSGAVVKASAGTAGMIPVVRGESAVEVASQLQELGFWVVGLDSKSTQSVWDVEVGTHPVAFVVGNEGRGIRKKTGELCDFLVSIPMENQVESLNASVSAALLCYEWKRQRM